MLPKRGTRVTRSPTGQPLDRASTVPAAWPTAVLGHAVAAGVPSLSDGESRGRRAVRLPTLREPPCVGGEMDGEGKSGGGGGLPVSCWPLVCGSDPPKERLKRPKPPKGPPKPCAETVTLPPMP